MTNKPKTTALPSGAYISASDADWLVSQYLTCVRDKDRLDWLAERATFLHCGVDSSFEEDDQDFRWYSLCYTGNPIAEPLERNDLRAVIDLAMSTI